MSKRNKKEFIGVIRELEEIIITQSGADVFSEVFKLIYSKMVDEIGVKSRKHPQKFLVSSTMQADIKKLFSRATLSWTNVFVPQETFNMGALCLESCVKVFDDILVLDYDIDEATRAFEYILPDVAKKKRGQYFTPDHIINLMVSILNPLKGELVIDPACGSGGYLIKVVEHLKAGGLGVDGLKSIYGVDIDDKSVKIAQAIQVIAGDGFEYRLNKMDSINTRVWEGLGLGKHKFDVLISNPPFSGSVSDEAVLRDYELAFGDKERLKPRMDRHVLFLERVFDLLAPGGRAALVLPQGVFSNKNMASIREYLLTNARVLAVVSLDKNIFRPYTDTKTSVVFLKRWVAKADREVDYFIFMAASERSGKDNHGKMIYKKGEDGGEVLDHDLLEILEKYRELMNS